MNRNLFKKIAVAGLAAVSLSAVGLMNGQTAKAMKGGPWVATVTKNTPAHLYDINGNAITNRALAPESAWVVANVQVINGQDYYQVSTKEYLKATDSSMVDTGANQKNDWVQPSNLVVTVYGGNAHLYNDQEGGISTTRMLAKGTPWRVARTVFNKNGTYYFQVSTHEWLNGNDAEVNMTPDNVEEIDDFALNPDGTSIEYNNDHHGNTTNTDVPGLNYPGVSLSDVRRNVIAEINQYASVPMNGTETSLNNAAQIRAKELATYYGNTRPDGRATSTVLNENGVNYSSSKELIGMTDNQFDSYKDLKGISHEAYYEMQIAAMREDNEFVMNGKYYSRVGVGVYYDQPTKHFYTVVELAN